MHVRDPVRPKLGTINTKLDHVVVVLHRHQSASHRKNVHETKIVSLSVDQHGPVDLAIEAQRIEASIRRPYKDGSVDSSRHAHIGPQ